MYGFKTSIEVTGDVLSLCISPDETMAVACCSDGKIRCYGTQRRSEDYVLDTMRAQASKLPVTCAAFRPVDTGSRVRNILAAGTAVGTIEHWHVTSRKCIHTLDAGSEIYCIDYREDGAQFAAAGKDGTILIGDESGKGVISRLSWAQATDDRDLPSQAHSSRVQSVKWLPRNPECLVSGGWDQSLQLWDTRVDHAVGSLYGAYLCGDSMCISFDGNLIYTASCRDRNQIEVRDIREPSAPAEVLRLGQGCNPSTHFYSLALSQDSALAAVGATDFVYFPSLRPPASSVSLLWDNASPLFAVAFSDSAALMAAGGTGGHVRLYERAS